MEFVSGLVKKVLEKAADKAVKKLMQALDMENLRKKLEHQLRSVEAMLERAEEMSASNKALEVWLENLKIVAEDANDVLSEFRFEETRLRAMGDWTRNLASLNKTPFRFRMSSKLESLLERIDSIVNQMNKYVLLLGRTPEGPSPGRPPSLAHVDESALVGRDEEKERIVQLLSAEHLGRDVEVLSIRAHGGMGKTTLAQMIYKSVSAQMIQNSAEEGKKFNLLIWVHVKENFDVVDIVKQIIEDYDPKCLPASNNLQALQKNLRPIIEGKRYLLFLDDVWNIDAVNWEILKGLLNNTMSSRIVITTRYDIASVVQPFETHNLKGLPSDQLWRIFEKTAFMSEQERSNTELIHIGKALINKCDGSPLAAKSLGITMSSLHTVKEWNDVLQKDMIWDSSDLIISTLRFSYKRLPAHLKQCFAFCAIFPRGYEIHVDKLVQLWMANDLILGDNATMEEKGYEFFKDLQRRLFFLDGNLYGSDSYSKCNQKTWKMYDLMHALAVSLGTDNGFVKFTDSMHLDKIPEKTRHLSCQDFWFNEKELQDKKNSQIPCSCGLVTDVNPIYKMESLRLLQWHGFVEITTDLWKHLKYLDMSDSHISQLPEKITTLYNLQTLRLSRCTSLTHLPRSIIHLLNLQHLYIDGCLSLRGMPIGIGQLSLLRILTDYVVRSEIGYGHLEELEGLNLKGRLRVSIDVQYTTVEDATKARLSEKKDLEVLELDFTLQDPDPAGDVEKTERLFLETLDLILHEEKSKYELVLESLCPHRELKLLVINGYKGNKLPSQIQSLKGTGKLLLDDISSRSTEGRSSSFSKSGWSSRVSWLLYTVLAKAGKDSTKQFMGRLGLEQERKNLEHHLAALLGALQHILEDTRSVEALEAVKDAAYRADDVLEEYSANEKMHKWGMASKKLSGENKLTNISKEIHIVEERVRGCHRQNTVEDKPTFQIEEQSHYSMEAYNYIVGREKERNEVVQLLISENNGVRLQVICIVGMGGIGKTTLARMIFNDHNVRNHFQLCLWVLVGQGRFDIADVMRKLIEDATNYRHSSRSLEVLEETLQEVIRDKPVLLVLDDMWDVDYETWERLEYTLRAANKESRIVITTRSFEIPALLKVEFIYRLPMLEDAYLWKIFESAAFSSEQQMHPEFKEIGMKIVEICQGLPLAAKTLGAQMRRSQHTVNQSRNILYKVSSRSKDSVMSILKLSYDQLPPYMKQCFAICAVFPLDYAIQVGELIQLWIANDFVPSVGATLESTAKKIFMKLEALCLLYRASSDSTEVISDQSTCMMHDLIKDFAGMITRNECANLLTFVARVSREVRHLSCKAHFLDDEKFLETCSLVRTLLCQSETSGIKYLDKMECLRALLWHGPAEFRFRQFPCKHLRYIGISNSHITEPPEEIAMLYSLQTLHVSQCSLLTHLPGNRFELNSKGKMKWEGSDKGDTGLKFFPNLEVMILIDCPSLETVGLSANLKTLRISNCATFVKTFGRCHLEEICIRECPAFELQCQVGGGFHDFIVPAACNYQV